MTKQPYIVFLLLVAWMMTSNAETRPAKPPCPTLSARDITEETETHTVRLVFPAFSQIDPASLGDGDLTVLGADGFSQDAIFEGVVNEPLPSLPFEESQTNLIRPLPRLVAIYSFIGPGENWDLEDNGSYRVRLNDDSITTLGGINLTAKFLGGFRCVIDNDEPETIQPIATAINFRRFAVGDSVEYIADVTLTFNTAHVKIDWGELGRTRDGFITNITAIRLPLTRIEDPILVESADEIAEFNRTGIRPSGGLTIAPTFRHSYRLGALSAGEYRFTASVNSFAEATEQLVIPSDPPVDEDAPKTALNAQTIVRESSDPYRFEVVYKDSSGVDVATLDDEDIMVLSPCFGLSELIADPCPSDWKAQKARLVNVIPQDRRLMVVRAIYEIEPPFGAWRPRNNGFYPILLERGQVCDQIGNCNPFERLGGFEVAIDDNAPPVLARAELSVDASDPLNVTAKVHVEFRSSYAIVDQGIRRDGNRIYLTAKALPTPDIIGPPNHDPTTQANLSYEIGALRAGDYYAGFLINGHLFDRENFEVRPAPPIAAEVAMRIDSSDPANVTARVEVNFRTPHRLTQGEVTRQGSRIILSARAEPLPIPLDPNEEIPIPAPTVLEYAIGELPPGGYLGAFVMNGFAYATEDFVIEDPGPPIPAEVRFGIDQTDGENSIGRVRIAFETPHTITSKEVHRIGNRFVFDVTARPFVGEPAPNVRLSRIVDLEFPLGDLPAGDYSAAFLMNGYPYATTTWTEPDQQFEARVDAEVAQDSDGRWFAAVKVKFADQAVRITSPGEVTSTGPVLMVNATAELTTALDVPEDFQFRYDLGDLTPGAKWFKFFINGIQEARVDFIVPAIPARVALAFDTSSQPSTATATIQFRDHYRITSQSIRRIGNYIVLLAEADGPLPILAPLPPQPITLTYDLGDLEPGRYIGGFMMNGHLYTQESFQVERDSLEVDVSLTTEIEDSVILKAKVDFEDPFVIVTDPGTPQITGRYIRINATAARVDFFAPPSGDPQIIDYDLGELASGSYFVQYSINGVPEARASFNVPEVCQPIPHLVSIRPGEEDGEWFSRIVLALSPGQQVLDWGIVRQSVNEFHVNPTIVCVDSPILPVPVDPVPPNELPEGLQVDDEGLVRMGGSPIRLVSHTYPLGDLPAGSYKFFVHSRSQTLGCQPFRVEGAPPKVELSVSPITEDTDEHSFGINFSDRSGLDHDSIREATVWITGPDNYREVARQTDYGSTDDEPSTGGFARYAVNGPDGSWDRPDNGGYRIHIEAEKVRDLQGNAIEESTLGGFRVRILAVPDPGVSVSFSRNEEGNWSANVEIISQPGQQLVVDSWGPLILHGHSFVALASVHLEDTTGPVEPIAHSYDLGPLQPGYYAFVFKTNLAHCGTGALTVPGVEAPPIDRWLTLTGNTSENNDQLLRYFFALNPNVTTPELEAEIVENESGESHLGIRFSRLTGAEGITPKFQASAGLNKWEPVTESMELIERTLDIDGTEEVLFCLRQNMTDSPFRYLRVVLEEEK